MYRFLILCFLSTLGWAADHQVSVNVDGFNYQCSAGGGGTPDPNCVRSVSEWCRTKTSYTATMCFEKGTSACHDKGTGYAICVTGNADYCRVHTTYTATMCFEKALAACRGDGNALLELMEGVRVSGGEPAAEQPESKKY